MAVDVVIDEAGADLTLRLLDGEHRLSLASGNAVTAWRGLGTSRQDLGDCSDVLVGEQASA
jgi:hypothetical protein